MYACPGCGKIWKVTDRMQIRDGIVQHVLSKHPGLFEKAEAEINPDDEQGLSDLLDCGDK